MANVRKATNASKRRVAVVPAAGVQGMSKARDPSAHPQVRLELMSNPLYLSGAREMVSAIARRFGFSEETCGQMALAVDEALCNVIRHGYGRDPSRPIWLSMFPVGGDFEPQRCCSGECNGHPKALKIVIEDEAPQIDPAQIRSRDLEEVRPGGLGVHIIRTVMDEVVYERREKVGMRLTMLKNRVPGPQAPALAAQGGKERSHG